MGNVTGKAFPYGKTEMPGMGDELTISEMERAYTCATTAT